MFFADNQYMHLVGESSIQLDSSIPQIISANYLHIPKGVS